MSTTTARESIDMRGRTITTFVLYNAALKLKDMAPGDVLEITTDDYEAIDNDIVAWCRMTGHSVAGFTREADCVTYLIEKGTPVKNDGKLALVVSNPGLEELLSPLGFALAAALSGSDVYIYFQGPAVRVLKRGFKEKLSGMSRPFSAFARSGLAKVGHIPPQDKLRQLRDLGAHLYMCGPSMDHFGVKKGELIFDDIIVGEYLSFAEVMRGADIQIYL